MVDENSINHLITFVHNLENKLISVKIIHDKLYQLISILSKTNQTIIEDFKYIKNILNQINIQQEEEDEIIPIDLSRSEWDDDDDDDDDDDEIELRKINSASTNENCNLNKHSSNLKKSNQLISTIKSPKSVTFYFEKDLHNQQIKKFNTNFQQFSKEKKNLSINEITTPIIPSLSPDILKENQLEIIPINEKNLTNIRIDEIESINGDYLRIRNLSYSDDYDLTEHFLQQNIHSNIICRFQFPFNTIIRAGQTITIWCGRSKGINPQPPYVFLWKEQRKWETRPECITILAKPDGQSIARYRNSHQIQTDQSSSDILFVRSKSNTGSSEVSNTSSNSIKNVFRPIIRQSRFSSFHFFGNSKPPFAHSTNNPIHPDNNGTPINIPNDLRSQMHQKSGISHLLNRPKSSPFTSHKGSKQDLITLNLLKIQKQKQTTVKT